MHGYLMIYATDKIWLSDRTRQNIVNNNNENNKNNIIINLHFLIQLQDNRVTSTECNSYQYGYNDQDHFNEERFSFKKVSQHHSCN